MDLSKRMLRTREAAVLLGMSEVEVRRALREGLLPGVRIGARWRLHPDVLEEYIVTGGRGLECDGRSRRGLEAREEQAEAER